ncbi:immunoglobulin superfamily member 11 isoform X3 [Gracilinanus agilis]|uniref:immunoglobulin superfamily member 11 isoform X3 n=1 Tax=Gracilinanus agilis TaxID=191870 RepID=UPI001CFE9587|nr:immunoglobulin superfamily member 11 isoform X3 [Gracilinanus agilis]
MVIPLSNANQPEQVILYQAGQMSDGAPRFHGRVGFTGTMPATNVSIFINNTQLMDTGTYQCLVNNRPDTGGRNIGVTGLTVLVPPSVPLCRIQGSKDIGSDVILICSSEEGIPRPTYLWEKLDNIPRLPPSATQDQIHGTVTLRNISSVSSGLYQCVASNAIGTSTCLLDLQVISRAFFYWRSRNKEEEEEEIPNEIREDDLPPKCTSSAKAYHAEVSSSENNTLTSSNTYNSRYWNNNPKVHHTMESYGRPGDLHQSFSLHSGSANIPSIYANGSHLVPPSVKTLVVTANKAPSPQATSRSNGSISRKPRSQHTHSYAVSQTTLERIGAVPVMVPAQSRAGSLV